MNLFLAGLFVGLVSGFNLGDLYQMYQRASKEVKRLEKEKIDALYERVEKLECRIK